MRVLCTGGCGYIGSHVVDELVRQDIETYVLRSGFRSKKKNVSKDAHIIVGDLRDFSELRKATKDMDFVFHLGGIVSHYCDKYPDLAIDVNIKGTWNLKKACVRNSVKRIVFASSSFVYGDPIYTPVTEEHPTNPKDVLGITKLAAEKILQAPHPSQINYTILRLFNIYGPRQYSDKLYTSVISTWMPKALKNEPLEIHADGKQNLDFVYVGDVAKAFAYCLHDNAENQVFNVGSGKPISMNQLASLINTITKNMAKPYYNPKHPAYFKFVQADIQKIKQKLGWHPSTTLYEGLQSTAQFFKEGKYNEDSC